jgi:hypothetical protein
MPEEGVQGVQRSQVQEQQQQPQPWCVQDRRSASLDEDAKSASGDAQDAQGNTISYEIVGQLDIVQLHGDAHVDAQVQRLRSTINQQE